MSERVLHLNLGIELQTSDKRELDTSANFVRYASHNTGNSLTNIEYEGLK